MSRVSEFASASRRSQLLRRLPHSLRWYHHAARTVCRVLNAIALPSLVLVFCFCKWHEWIATMVGAVITTVCFTYIFLFITGGSLGRRYARLLEAASPNVTEWKLGILIENYLFFGEWEDRPLATPVRETLVYRLKQATEEELLDLDGFQREALRSILINPSAVSKPVVEAILSALTEHPLPEYTYAVRRLARGRVEGHKTGFIQELAQKCLEGLQREANSQNYHLQLLRQPTEAGKDTLLRPAVSSPSSSEPASQLLRPATSSASASPQAGIAPASAAIAEEQTLRAQSSQAE